MRRADWRVEPCICVGVVIEGQRAHKDTSVVCPQHATLRCNVVTAAELVDALAIEDGMVAALCDHPSNDRFWEGKVEPLLLVVGRRSPRLCRVELGARVSGLYSRIRPPIPPTPYRRV
jgi:hypothetical protein